MAQRSNKEFYREYLRDHPERETSPWVKAIAAAGLVGGGFAAYKSGALRPIAERLISGLGKYRMGKVNAVSEGLRNWTKREFKGGGRTRYKMKMLQMDIEDSLMAQAERKANNFGKTIAGDKMGTLTHIVTERNRVLEQAESIWQRMSQAERDVATQRYGGRAGWESALRDKLNSKILGMHNINPAEQAEQLKRTGYRHATLGEVLNSGHLEAEQEATLRMAVADTSKHDSDMLNKVFDHKVLIHGKTGEFSDVRDFAQSFTGMLDAVADDFTIPFVKINPIRMLYLNQFNASKRTPVFEILERMTIQPNITKNTNAMSSDMLFMDGSVVRMNNIEDVVKDNVRLVDAKAGPIARYYRNMTGVSTSRYDMPTSRWGRLKYNVSQFFDVGFQDEPIGRDISWNFEMGERSFELPHFSDPATWPSYIAKKVHQVTKPYEGVKRIYLKEAFGKDSRYLVFNNYKGVEDAGGYRNWMKQFNAGRKDLDNVTTATLFPYAFFERLNSTLNQAGLGLSNEHLGSAFDIAQNLFLRRFLPVLGVVEAWNYANTVSDDVFGVQPEDAWAKFYAGTTTDIAKLRDATGITDWAKHFSQLMPGGEQISEMPMVGGLLDWNDSAEETAEYWKNGEDAVRRGRYWEFGNTPFTGAKIDHFEPNWVRRTLSDYEFTDSLYGSRNEYFANTWYPTPTHPLAPIKHYFTDPYHWEKKHYYDRPYMMTNGFSELENIPLIGQAANNVASFFLKPNTPMHKQYWEASKGETNSLEAPVLNGDFILPTFDTVVDDFAVDPIANRAAGGESYQARYARLGAQKIARENIESHEITSDGEVVRREPTAAELAGSGGTQTAAYITASGQVKAARISAGMIRDLNERLREKGLASVGAYTGNASDSRLRDGAPIFLPPEEIMAQSDIRNTVSNLYNNMTDMGGAYGFFTTLAVNDLGKGPVLADPNDMTSFKRTFWDGNWGNLGGDANEIFRRALPKDQRQEKYNPIPNRMPSWMPGTDYFTDFQHGDAYTKVMKGEMRLPGEGYEQLYGLDIDDDLSIGASFIGKEIPEIVNHMLRRDEIIDDDDAYVLKTGTGWHERWEAQMAKEGVALDFEQHVSNKELGISGFYDVKANHARWLEKAMEEADVFKYYGNAKGDGADRYGGLYDEGIDIKELAATNPEEYRRFIEESLDAPMAILDPKTMSHKKYEQDEMFFHNVQQVNFYLYQTGQKRGYLIHVDRDDIEDGDRKEGMKVYGFDFNPELLGYSVDKVEAARQHIKAGMKDGTYGRGDFYDFIDRFRILADVAPYSKEYREMKSNIRSWEYLTDEQRAEVNEIEDQVSAKKENLRLYPYRFKTSDIKKQTVTIREVLDNNTFLTEELDHPIKLAGVRAPTAVNDPNAKKASKLLGLKEGSRVTIGIDADELNQVNRDTYGSISAVVYNKGINVNRKLIASGVGTEKTADFSPAAVHARFSDSEILFGSAWESLAHFDSPYNTKFLQVRSPLESYQIRETYNKDWQDWGDPVDDFFIPWYQNIIRKNPFTAMLMGTLLGSAFGNTRYGKIVGAIGGLAATAAGVAYVGGFEATHDRAWVPERRLKEREMFEYLDVIKYVKNRRLYEETANKAMDEEDFDVRSYLAGKANMGEIRTSERNYLEKLKKRLTVGTDEERATATAEASERNFGSSSGDMIKDINARIKELGSKRQLEVIPEQAALAIQYYNESQRTMYAYDPGEPLENFLSALPKKDRDYLLPFMESPEEERQAILDVVPEYMRRTLQSSWGMKVDEKPDLVEYFEEHGLPDKDWVGWDPRSSLKDLKVKMVKKYGLDNSEFDIWPDDTKQSSYVNLPLPDMREHHTEASVERRLRDVLSGIGLEDVQVQVTRQEGGTGVSDIRANIKKDRREEIRQRMLDEARNLV